MRRGSIFRALDEQRMKALQPLFQPFSCEAGTTILQQGAPADYLYLIVRGTVEMSFKPYDGNTMTVAHVKKGGLFGWSAVVGSEEYTSSAIAIENVEALRVRGTELRQFCREHPEEGKYILGRLADEVSSRWKNAHIQIQALLVQGMKEKTNLV